MGFVLFDEGPPRQGLEKIQSRVLNLISITQMKYEHSSNPMSPRKLDAHVVL